MSELSEKVRAKFNSELYDHDKRPSEAMEAALAPVEAEIARLREAGREVVDWWLREGMDKFDGAPGAMFNLRAAIGYE